MKKEMRSSRVTRHLAPLLVLSGAMALLLVSSATGAAIPGATYNGTVTEATAGHDGDMSFTVSADGGAVTSFSLPGELEGVFGGGHCIFYFYDPESVNFSISNDAFSGNFSPFGNKGMFAGKFTGTQTAQGTLRVYETTVGCDTEDLSWSASTTATPPAPPAPPVAPPVTPGSTGQGGTRKAAVNGVASVKGGKALLKMRCPGVTTCKGVAKLWVTGSSRRSRRGGQSSATKRKARVLIGKSRFAIPAGKSRVVRIKLNRKGKRLLRSARRHRLRVRLGGRNVKRRTVLLK